MAASRRRGIGALAFALLLLAAVTRAEEPGAGQAASPVGSEPAAARVEPDPLFDDPEAADDALEGQAAPPLSDPIEPANRAFFRFNQKLDDWFWSPLNRAYRFVAPEPVREGIRRALRNLNTPIFVANHVLQLRFGDAAQTLGAFVLNSTLGIFGFFEPSKEAGWSAQPADFGQTLGLVGIGAGPYVVVPILGPTTVRDGFGSAVDRFFQPLNYVIGIPTQLLWGGSSGLSQRDESSEQLEALRKSAVDFYAVMRSAWWQNRVGELDVARRRRDAQLAYLLPDSWWRAEEPPAEPGQPAHD
jgi:phospholipid-binding lipoprotein MlaA